LRQQTAVVPEQRPEQLALALAVTAQFAVVARFDHLRDRGRPGAILVGLALLGDEVFSPGRRRALARLGRLRRRFQLFPLFRTEIGFGAGAAHNGKAEDRAKRCH
jgi:hypothetical protein